MYKDKDHGNYRVILESFSKHTFDENELIVGHTYEFQVIVK